MDNERRQAERKSLVLEVRYEGAGGRAETRICDISALGVYVDTLNPLPESSLVKLDFILPDGHRVKAEGAVIRNEPGIGMAVMFREINPEDRERIRALIDSYAQ